MPYIELKTNIDLSLKVKEELKFCLGKDIELINKSEDWLMINFLPNQSMYFKGSDSPCLIVEVKLYGETDSRLASKFTNVITSKINELTNIPKDRIYINYFSTDKWGYEGYNF